MARLGIGWHYPFQIDEKTGGIMTTADLGDGQISPEGEQAMLRMAIEQIVRTASIGERFMRPEFGANIFDLPFEPGDEALLGVIEYYVAEAITRWEPRLKLLRVDAVMETRGNLNVRMQYQRVPEATVQTEVIGFLVG